MCRMHSIYLVVLVVGVVVGEVIAENMNNRRNYTNYGTIFIGFIAESPEDEIDGEEHIQGYFQYVYEASGDPTPRSLNVTTFRMDIVEKNRDWLKLSQDLTRLIDTSPAMIIGSYRRVIDQLLPPQISYIVTTGSKVFMNNIDIQQSKNHENVCWSTDVGSNVISLLPPLNTFLNPLQMYLMKATGPDKTVVVIVESEEDLLHFNSGLWTRSGSTRSHILQFVRTMIRKDSGYWGIIDKLVAIQKLATPQIIIHSYDLKYIKNITDGARDLNMVTYLYKWYLTYPDFEGIGDELSTFFLSHYSNVTGFQLIDSDMLNQAMPLKGNGLNHAIIYDAMKILVETLPKQRDAVLDIEDYFDTLKSGFNGSTGFYGDVSLHNLQTEKRQFCRIRSSYEWVAFEGGEFTRIGTYLHDNNSTSNKKQSLASYFASKLIPSKPFKLKEPTVKYRAKPKDLMPIFNKMPVSVVAVDDPPMAILNPDGTFTGVMVDYLDEYAQKLNFTYEITKLIRHDEDGGGKRYVYPHRTMWTGAVGDILGQDAVLAIGAIGTTIEREVVMDFSETTLPGVISLMAKKPKIAYDTWQFLSPFSWKMWVGIGVVLVVISIVVTFLDLLDKTTHDFKNFPVRDSFYYTASILFFGSTDQRPNSAPMRLLVGFFVFFSIVVSQSYVANMAAFLTTRRSDESLPRTIDALSRQSVVPFGLMAQGEAMAMLTRATKGPYLYLRNKFEVEGMTHPTAPPETNDPGKAKARRFYSYDEAIAAVKNGSFIFISESPITRYFVHKDCELVVVDQDTDAVRYSIGMPKGALFRRELDRVITEVREEVSRDMAIMEKWYSELDCAKGGSDTMQANMKTTPLLWEEMKGLFITLGIGAGLAFVSAVIGHFFTRVKLPKPKRKPEVDGEIRTKDQEVPLQIARPTETATGPDGESGRGTKGMSSPGTSARARPLHLSPMVRP